MYVGQRKGKEQIYARVLNVLLSEASILLFLNVQCRLVCLRIPATS